MENTFKAAFDAIAKANNTDNVGSTYTVETLIKELQTLPQDAPIYINEFGKNKCEYLDDIEVLGNAVIFYIDKKINHCNTTFNQLYAAQ